MEIKEAFNQVVRYKKDSLHVGTLADSIMKLHSKFRSIVLQQIFFLDIDAVVLYYYT